LCKKSGVIALVLCGQTAFSVFLCGGRKQKKAVWPLENTIALVQPDLTAGWLAGNQSDEIVLNV